MFKCDKRAFSRCKYKESCGPDAEYEEESECEKFNKIMLERPMTNADCIRSMNDHDLAVFLEHAMYDSSEPDWMTVLSWLQQPAEEES